MKTVKNARSIALKSFSMWATYLGLITLIVPELRFLLTGHDTNPAISFWVGFALLVAGAIGRLVNQGISDG